MTKKQRVNYIIGKLEKEYPVAQCSLQTLNAFELLVATRLSAQCTDIRVNMVTPKLFERLPTPKDFAAADTEEIEELIKTCGLYKTKARDIKAMCIMLLERYNAQVPDSIEELTALPGVGRKTANLIMGEVFKKPAVITDTHCIRLSNRLSLVESDNPLKIENALRELLPPDKSTDFCHRLVQHGRAVCTARNPACDKCVLNDICIQAQKGL